jgi:Flp pilus assembly protein TadD
LQHYTKALETYQRALEIDPDNSIAFFDRGLVLTKLERSEEALLAYDRAITLDPANPNYRAQKMLLLDRLGRSDEGI